MATAKGARLAYVMGERLGKETLDGTRQFLAQGQADADRQIGLGLEALSRGYDTARGALGAAGDYYADLGQTATQLGQQGARQRQRYAGFDGGLYQDALGVRGAEGVGRAQQAFQAGPGYQFALDQGLQALNRRRAAGGMLNSGNADADSMRYATGLANQEYGNWLSRLDSLDQRAVNTDQLAAGNDQFAANYGLSLANQRAGVQNNLANLATQYGLGQINYGTNPRAQMALQNAQQQGQLLADYNTNRTNLYTAAMQAGDAAKNANQANWIGAAKIGAQLLGTALGGPMGGAAASSLTSAFGGGQAGATGAPMPLSGYTTF